MGNVRDSTGRWDDMTGIKIAILIWIVAVLFSIVVQIREDDDFDDDM